MESALVEAAGGHTLVLTATSRLARRVLHAYRSKKIGAGAGGWRTPAISSLNRWVKNSYDQLWEPFRPLSKLGGMVLWEQAVEKVSLPEGLKAGPSLYLELQKAFDLLTRFLLSPDGPAVGHLLADWRREVTDHFIRLLDANRYAPWVAILQRLQKAAEKGEIEVPQEIVLAGFDRLSPAEEALASVLGRKSHLSLWRAQRDPDVSTNLRVYATPEQECRSVCAEILGAWNAGRKDLGLVFLDPDYFPLVRQCFEELTDREERPTDALRYNLTLGTSLSEHPLFQTAMIPLRLQDEPDPKRLLASFLTSPYVRKEKEAWDSAVRASLWMTPGTRTRKSYLSDLERHGIPTQPFQEIGVCGRRPLRSWLEMLETLWTSFSFPVCRCETDTLAKEHLFDLLAALKREAGRSEVDTHGVLAWFASASRGLEVVEKTPEMTGIQVLNLVESKGLSFERLWVVGAHGRALPEPVRSLPFLDPDEIRNVEGGSAEIQWEAGSRNVSYLLASSCETTLSRSSSAGDDAAYLACPLIPDAPSIEKSSGESGLTVDLWKSPPREWLRARWLREGLHGMERRLAIKKPETDERVNLLVATSMDVTEFEDLLSCPFKYFARLLGLEPLEDAKTGLDPAERGTLIHRILRKFAAGLEATAPDWPGQQEKARAFLEKTVDEVLGTAGGIEKTDKGDDLFREVERVRLLGDGGFPGILDQWLSRERVRALEGWRFEAAEAAFECLSVGDASLSLKGRVDRVDRHQEEGRILWDYKTGNPPGPKEVLTEMLKPQLPAYLLALKKGLLHGLGPCAGKTKAGYISLKKASDVAIDPLEEARREIDWEGFLSLWEQEAAKRVEGPSQGIFRPDPRPGAEKRGGACEYCPYGNLCGIDIETMDEQ
jgi:ATP-dependent helicase/nuclease subunit B